MRTSQQCLSFSVAINGRTYDVAIDRTWENESPTERYDLTVWEGGEPTIEAGSKRASGYVTLRGAYVAAIDTIITTEEERHEPAV